MTKILVYTFRTFPQIDELKKRFGEVFVFDRLNESFEAIRKRISEEQPSHILGIAQSNSSCFEPLAINQFNKNKKVIRGAQDSFELYVPSSGFQTSGKASDSFCNWTMFKLAHSIHEQQLLIQLMFCHLAPKDIDQLRTILDELPFTT